MKNVIYSKLTHNAQVQNFNSGFRSAFLSTRTELRCENLQLKQHGHRYEICTIVRGSYFLNVNKFSISFANKFIFILLKRYNINKTRQVNNAPTNDANIAEKLFVQIGKENHARIINPIIEINLDDILYSIFSFPSTALNIPKIVIGKILVTHTIPYLLTK
jgi:hypothetical protein